MGWRLGRQRSKRAWCTCPAARKRSRLRRVRRRTGACRAVTVRRARLLRASNSSRRPATSALAKDAPERRPHQGANAGRVLGGFATSHATQPVQNLWINRAFPVDVSTAPCFFALMPEKVRSTGTVSAPSYGASLVSIRAKRRIALVSNSPSAPITVTAAVHRFEESIGGRPYVIEVAAVAEDRWRAYIVRLPGVPTALMPFCGSTPVEAAHLLSQWLTRAHERAANGAMPARRYLGSNTSMGIDRSADDPPRGRHEL
jgi:hypothetical protein